MHAAPSLKALTVSKKNQGGMRTKMNDGDNVNDDDDRDDIISLLVCCKIKSAGSQKPILLGCEIS